jgi:uncharacterized protein
MQRELILIGMGVFTGVLSGFFGIGGGIVMVPMLIFLMGYGQQTATGTSLVAMLLPVGILGVVQYYKAGKIGPAEIRAGLVLAIGIFVGAYFGSKLALQLPVALLKKAFACLLVFVAFKLWFQK